MSSVLEVSMLFYDGIKVYMQNGKLDDVEIAYYINKIRKTHKSLDIRKWKNRNLKLLL